MTDQYPRCRTCRWWRDGLCTKMTMLAQRLNDSGSFPADGIGCNGILKTGTAIGVPAGPEFGCIHHEPKEGNDHD